MSSKLHKEILSCDIQYEEDGKEQRQVKILVTDPALNLDIFIYGNRKEVRINNGDELEIVVGRRYVVSCYVTSKKLDGHLPKWKTPDRMNYDITTDSNDFIFHEDFSSHTSRLHFKAEWNLHNKVLQCTCEKSALNFRITVEGFSQRKSYITASLFIFVIMVIVGITVLVRVCKIRRKTKSEVYDGIENDYKAKDEIKSIRYKDISFELEMNSSMPCRWTGKLLLPNNETEDVMISSVSDRFFVVHKYVGMITLQKFLRLQCSKQSFDKTVVWLLLKLSKEIVCGVEFLALNEDHSVLTSLSPEALLLGEYVLGSDVWSLGMTLWEVFSGGSNPYPGITLSEMKETLQNLKGKRPPKPTNISGEIYDVMQSCWVQRVSQRPTATAIREKLKAVSSYFCQQPFDESRVAIKGIPESEYTTHKISTLPLEISGDCENEEEGTNSDQYERMII
ncbi:Fibroblast growth factor receptor 1 [Holothuria leucospilota]|uniref:Fibroblast growth factor receptor 1 n=1 Tax=Holothuria leucospilota TaxID=206669 RepID=A0A9Q1H618_HOLLE|nr:Fibroblast growth factor receptor 1 [Holothuria leucospilota]